jgi:hypothetical protein
LIDEKKSKASHNLADLVGETHDQADIEIMEAISILPEIKNYNVIAISNKPFRGDCLAALMLSLNHCVTTDNGAPAIDFEMFNRLDAAEKKKEIDGILLSIGGMIDTLEKLKDGLIVFAGELLKLGKECSK